MNLLGRLRRGPRPVEFEPRVTPATYVEAQPLLYRHSNEVAAYGGRDQVARTLVTRAALRLEVYVPDWVDRLQPHLMVLETTSRRRCVLGFAFRERSPDHPFRTGMEVLYGVRPGTMTPPERVPNLPADALAFTGMIETSYWLDHLAEVA